MMKTTRRILKGAVTLALVAVLAAPAGAYAIPGRGLSGTNPRPGGIGTPIPSNDATRQAVRDQRLALLRQRIETVLRTRKARFDAIAERLSARITRVSAFADKVEKAGGDVSAVRAGLGNARSLLEQAKLEEAKAVELFKAVPDAADKKAAFKAARAQGRIAVETLHSARATLRKAILDLRAIVNGLKGAGQ